MDRNGHEHCFAKHDPETFMANLGSWAGSLINPLCPAYPFTFSPHSPSRTGLPYHLAALLCCILLFFYTSIPIYPITPFVPVQAIPCFSALV